MMHFVASRTTTPDRVTPGHRHRFIRLVALGAAAATAGAMALIGTALPAAAAGTTLLVATSGTDSSTCGPAAAPCETIGQALDNAVDGDTISISPGTYSEALTVDESVTLQGTSQADVVLDNQKTDGTPTITIDAGTTAAPVTVSGMTIHPGTVSDTSISGTTVLVTSGSNATLTGVTVTPPTGATTGASGIVAAKDSVLALEDSTVSRLLGTGVTGGVDPADSSNSGAADITITDTTVDDNYGAGIDLAAGTATITGGSVSGNGYVGLSGRSPGVSFNVTGTQITGNGAATGGSSTGGVAFQNGGTLHGTDVTIDGNSNGIVLQGGGSISLAGHSSVSNNGVADDAYAGLGIFGRSASSTGSDPAPLTMTIDGTTISGNEFGLVSSGGDVTVADSHIDGNAGTGIRIDGASGSTHIPTLAVRGSVISGNGPSSVDGNSQPSGGILSTTGADITVTDSQIKDNTAGITAYAGPRISVTNSDVVDNIAGISGASGTAISITGSTITGNSAYGVSSSGAGDGAGATVDLRDSTIADNGLDPAAGPAAGSPPAGVVSMGTPLIGKNLTIDGNATGVVALGSITLTDSSVTGSVAIDDGGVLPTGSGVVAYFGTATIEHSTISDNASHGIWALPGAALTVATSTIASNGGFGISDILPATAEPDPDGGPSQLLLTGSTVAGNSGGAIEFADGLTATVAGSILQAPTDAAVCVGDAVAVTDDGYNVASDNSCALDSSTSVTGDPQLGPLADNGGPTLTMLPAATSPAVNVIPAGSSAGSGSSATTLCGTGITDQRGISRPQGSACDAGAVEREHATLTVTASDATTYDGAAPATVTPSYSGFIGDDTAADLDTPPTCAINESAGSTQCSGGSDSFYEFTYVPGELTVLDPLVITTDTLPDGTVGEHYSVTLQATGGTGAPYTWGIDSGALPDGLTLNTATGEISGVPEADGDATVTIAVGDPITKEFAIHIAAAPETTPETTEPPVISVGTPHGNGPSTLPDGTANTPYDETPTVDGGTGPYTWSAPEDDLPPGVTIDPSTGHISGTPTKSGTYTFTLTVTDSHGVSGQTTVRITIAEPTATTTPTSQPAPSTGSTATPTTVAPTTTVISGDKLAETGFPARSGITIGALALLLGAGLTVVARRRERARRH